MPTMKRIACKKCGVEHDCAGTLSASERGRKAVQTRWNKTAGRAGSELAEAAIEKKASIAQTGEQRPRNAQVAERA